MGYSSIGINQKLKSATCQVFIKGELAGTAWLCTEDGHVVTAGHFFEKSKGNERNLKIKFLDHPEQEASVVYWNLQRDTGIDVAILKISNTFNIVPLPVSLTKTPSGEFWLRGFGKTLVDSSAATGTFVDTVYLLNQEENFAFRLSSKESGEKGYSGAAIFSSNDGGVVGIQIEATTTATGAARDTELAMPMYRIAKLWPKIEEYIGQKSYKPHMAHGVHGSSGSKTRLHGVSSRSKFFAREYMEKLMDKYLDNNQIIALTGISGCGKTYSANEFVYRLTDAGCAPQDIVWIAFGHNTKFSLNHIINKIALELGFDEINVLMLERKAQECLRILSSKDVLFIFDNFELNSINDISEFVSFINNLPRGCRLLITTTVDNLNTLKNCERVYIGNLDEPLTKDMALYYARKFDPPPINDNDKEILSDIFKCTGGSIKAISLIVSAMRFRNPREILDNIQKIQNSEKYSNKDDDETKAYIEMFESQHSMVWEYLSGNAKSLLVSISLMNNSATGEALSAVSGLKYNQLSLAIEELVSAFLLEVRRYESTYRYELHQSTYLFAISQRKNINFDVSAAMLQLTDYYTNFLRSYPEGADIVETDTPTIIACAKWCSSNNEHKALIDIAFWSYDILFSLGLFNERIETAHLATESAIKSHELSLAAHFITVSASTYTIIGNYDLAESELELGLKYAEESNDGLRIAYMKRCISLNYYRQGYVNEACKPLVGLTEKLRELIQDEHNLDRLNELRHAYIDILALMGAIEFFNKEYSSALTTFGDMLSACNEAEWKRAISYPLRDLGEIAMVYENNFPKAYKHLTDALELAKDYRDYRQIGKIELSLAKYMLHKNKLAKANQHFLSAYDLFMRMGLDNELEELEALYNGKSSNSIAKKMHRLSFSFKKIQGYYGTKPIGGE